MRHTKSVGALAIEGINRTALDVTKEVLSDCVDPPTGAPEARSARLTIFATITGGIASLPIEPIYFELGPVFDLDYLDWRTNQRAEAEPEGSSLPIEADHAIQAYLRSMDTNTEEAIRLARLFLRKRNPTVERMIARAYQALHVIRSDQKDVTPLSRSPMDGSCLIGVPLISPRTRSTLNWMEGNATEQLWTSVSPPC